MSKYGEQVDTQEMVRLNVTRVNRDDQINKFNDVLKNLRREPSAASLKTILEWFGAPGMGKSFLVKMLYANCHHQGIPAALINFRHEREQGREPHYVADPTELVFALAEQIFEAGSPFDRRFKEAYEIYRHTMETIRPAETIIKQYAQLDYDKRYFNKPAWLLALEGVMQEFKTAVFECAQASEWATIVLFFDETDWVDQIELIDWIEEAIINPLTQARRCIVIWTARRPWRWKLPDVRIRLDLMELQPFTQDETREQILRLVDSMDLAEDFFQKVRHLTGGNPFANKVVGSHVSREKPTAEATSEAFQAHLSRSVFEEFVQQHAFERFHKDEREAFKLLAMVRTFDTTMMREVLNKCSSMFNDSRQEDFGELLLRLKRSQLVLWNKGHRLEGTLREIISRYHYDCDRTLYIKVNETALEVYKRWLEQPIDNRSLYLIEELYHQVCLVYANVPIDIEAEFEERLREYAERFQDNPEVSRKAFDYLYEEILNDTSLKMQFALLEPEQNKWQSLLDRTHAYAMMESTT